MSATQRLRELRMQRSTMPMEVGTTTGEYDVGPSTQSSFLSGKMGYIICCVLPAVGVGVALFYLNASFILDDKGEIDWIKLGAFILGTAAIGFVVKMFLF